MREERSQADDLPHSCQLARAVVYENVLPLIYLLATPQPDQLCPLYARETTGLEASSPVHEIASAWSSVRYGRIAATRRRRVNGHGFNPGATTRTVVAPTGFERLWTLNSHGVLA
jgi:hypothetical protein